jgi:glycosyltransferase involved in cell wall biosynthesis
VTAPSAEQTFSIVCLSQSRWNAPLPTNRQQVMRCAAARGHRVLFVETAPFLGRRLLSRAERAALHSPHRARAEVATLAALNVVPGGHRRRLPNLVNTRATAWLVRRAARSLPQPVVLWIYDPVAAGLIGRCGERFSVYDCVDDYPSLEFYSPGARALAARGDRRAASGSRLVFATTSSLYERHLELNARTFHVPNVGDYEHFANPAGLSAAARELGPLGRPIIGFAGNLMAEKVDLQLLRAVAVARPDWTVLLIGPAAGAARREVEAAAVAAANLVWLGQRPYAELPDYVAGFDVALCPNRWNDYGRSCFPLKLYEYLAAGKPVVASGNPDLAGMEPDVLLVRGVDEFVAAVELALQSRAPADRLRRQALASTHTWESRVGRMLELVQAELDLTASRAVPVTP